MRFSLIFLFIFFYNLLLAQNKDEQFIKLYKQEDYKGFITLFEQNTNQSSLIKSISTIVYCNVGNHEKAENQLKSIQKTVEKENFAAFYFAKANYFEEKSIIDSALFYVDLSRENLNDESAFFVRNSTLDNVLGRIYLNESDFEESLEYFYKALDQERKSAKKEPIESTILNNIGAVYHYQGKFDQALNYYLQSYEKRKDFFEEDNYGFSYTLYNVGLIYEIKGNNDKAIDNYTKALEIRKKWQGEFHSDIGDLYVAIAYQHKLKRQYETAIQFYHKNIDLHLKVNGENHQKTALAYQNFAFTLTELKELSLAKTYFDKAISINSKVLKPNNYQYLQLYNHLYLWYQYSDDLDSAKFYAQKAIELSEIIDAEFSSPAMDAKIALIGLNLMQNDVKNSTQNIQKFEQNLNKKEVPEFFHLRKLFELKASLALLKNDSEKFNKNIEKALELCYAPIGNEKIIIDLISYLDLWLLKANWIKKQAVSEQNLEQFRAELKLLYNEVRQMNNSSSEEDKIKINSTLKEIFGIVVQQYFTLYENNSKEKYIEIAFELIQQSKGIHLYESLMFRQALNLSNIPDSLKQKVQDLQIDIAFWKNEIHYYNTFEEAVVERENLFKTTKEYNELLEKIKQIDEDLARVLNQEYSVKITSVQQISIDKGFDLVEFAVYEDNIFAIVVNQNTAQFVKIEETELLREITDNWLDKIQTKSDLAIENEQLLERIIEPILSYLTTDKTVVISDDFLTKIPFGAIKKDKYLIENHAFSYHFSSKLFLESKSVLEKDKIVVFKPDYNNSNFTELPFATQEIDFLEEYNANTFEDGKATKQNFIDEKSDINIFHFSGHGIFNQTNNTGFIEFTPSDSSKMLMSEIYNTIIPTNLTVLSACNTHKGKVKSGEGVFSITRAFYFAGSRNLITTLWKANDYSISNLTIDFYRNLAEGKDYSTALRESKINYLQNTPDKLLHPYYWAGIVHFGQIEKNQITTKNNAYKYIIISIVGFILVVIVFRLKQIYLRFF